MLLVAPGRDDTAALIVLSARQFNPVIAISASVRACVRVVENKDLLRQGKPIGLWEVAAETIEAGAAVIEIGAVGNGTPPSENP